MKMMALHGTASAIFTRKRRCGLMLKTLIIELHK